MGAESGRVDGEAADRATHASKTHRQEAPDAFAAFLAEAGLGRVEEPLKRCGISTLQQLRDTPAAALKAAVDPQTGSRVLAVGPLSKLRAALREHGQSPASRGAAAAGARETRGRHGGRVGKVEREG